MVINQIGIVQGTIQNNTGECRSAYHFYTANNTYLGYVLLPSEGQYAFDVKVLHTITRSLAVRWRIIPMPKKF